MTPFCETKPKPLRTARQIVVTTTRQDGGEYREWRKRGDAQDDVGSGVNDVNEPADADEGNLQGVDPSFPRATVPSWAARCVAELLVPMDPAALFLLSDAEPSAELGAVSRETKVPGRFLVRAKPTAAGRGRLLMVIGR